MLSCWQNFIPTPGVSFIRKSFADLVSLTVNALDKALPQNFHPVKPLYGIAICDTVNPQVQNIVNLLIVAIMGMLNI